MAEWVSALELPNGDLRASFGRRTTMILCIWKGCEWDA